MLRKLAVEFLGSLLLAAAVIGSGVMAERLAGGNVSVALLANTAATVAMLATLIGLFAPISGAHFNPAVTFVACMLRRQPLPEGMLYVLTQVIGCCLGAVLAHTMFELPLLQSSTQDRSGTAKLIAEFVATFGLLMVVLGNRRVEDAPWMIAGWIGAAYWFTSSTSFANPAITVARSLTDTFSGIRPSDITGFIAVQLLAAGCATLIGSKLFKLESERSAKSNAESTIDKRI